ncbi:MAG: 4-methyl-5(b-hydroxyethyl)-thiazole monophosphate biosynthesis, partial [Candidatus Marinamargulisbacteria bacterium]
TTHLKASLSLSECIKAQYAAGKLVAAICAAPTVLEAAGIMAGKRGTSYPSYASDMTSCLYSDENIVVDDTIITSRGPGTAMAFGYQILESLKSKDVSNRLREAMIAV